MIYSPVLLIYVFFLRDTFFDWCHWYSGAAYSPKHTVAMFWVAMISYKRGQGQKRTALLPARTGIPPVIDSVVCEIIWCDRCLPVAPKDGFVWRRVTPCFCGWLFKRGFFCCFLFCFHVWTLTQIAQTGTCWGSGTFLCLQSRFDEAFGSVYA